MSRNIHSLLLPCPHAKDQRRTPRRAPGANSGCRLALLLPPGRAGHDHGADHGRVGPVGQRDVPLLRRQGRHHRGGDQQLAEPPGPVAGADPRGAAAVQRAGAGAAGDDGDRVVHGAPRLQPVPHRAARLERGAAQRAPARPDARLLCRLPRPPADRVRRWQTEGALDAAAAPQDVAQTLLSLILGFVVQSAIVHDADPAAHERGLLALCAPPPA